MIRKRHPLSRKAMEANRRNARKSTGPRTPAGKRRVALNAFKHGRYARASARPMWETMTDLGENPARFRAILQDILRSYPPRNPLQMMVCEDIAKLRRQRERNQQAQEARLQRSLANLEIDRHKRWREMTNRKSYDALQAEVLKTGLRRAPDSPSKFLELQACLERLLGRVEEGDFSQETELKAIYGEQPTFRGAGIVNTFRALAKTPPGARRDRDLYAGLRLMILEEARDVKEEYWYYTQEHVEISRAMRNECLAPAGDREYVVLRRQEAALDRQLERKIRLLLKMHADDTGRGAVLSMPLGEEAFAPMEKVGGGPPTPPAPQRGGRVAGGTPTGWGRSPTLQTSGDRALPALPGSTAEAADISLRHKLTRPADLSVVDEKAKWEEVQRKIREIYGLGQKDPTGAVETIPPRGVGPADPQEPEPGSLDSDDSVRESPPPERETEVDSSSSGDPEKPAPDPQDEGKKKGESP